jgi:tight adherence protein C
MMADWTPVLVAVLAFLAMAGIVYVAGQYYARAVQLSRRLPQPQGDVGTSSSGAGGIADVVARYFDGKRFGFDDSSRSKLRQNLVRAGYFRKEAVNFYVLWRIAAVIGVPVLTYLLLSIAMPQAPLATKLIVVVIAIGLGIVGPDAFIARRQRLLSVEYRNIFPDFLDLTVVCVDAGLGVEAALDRITGEISKWSKAFGTNLVIMSTEIRAGRSFVEALATLADRLMIAEARSLVAVLRQSIELGSDVAETLRVFSDEMRARRLLRAEEQANKLSVKMIIPLALFIFPVVLMVVLLPMAIRLFTAFR